MVLVALIIPISMIGCGTYLKKGGPADINALVGYRTALWVRNGWIMLPVCVLPFLFVFGKDVTTVAIVGGAVTVAELVPMLVPCGRTEAALKRTFDENGKRK